MTDHKAIAFKLEWSEAEPSRDQIIKTIKEGGVWSVHMLADELGIGRQTVGNIVREILSTGVIEQGKARVPGSRTKVPVYRWKVKK